MAEKKVRDFIGSEEERQDFLTNSYLKDLAHKPLLTHEENLKYARLAKKGVERQKNINKIVEGNLRLVFNVAKKYTENGLDFIDLLQLGNEGLIKAATKFDPDRGFKFSTHATWWIRQAISRGVANTGETIRVAVDKYNFSNKVRLHRINGKSKDEIMDLMDLTEAQYNEANRILNQIRNVKSLDAKIPKASSDQLNLVDVLEGDLSIEDQLKRKEQIKAIEDVFNNNLFTDEQKELFIKKTLDPKVKFRSLAKELGHKEKDVKAFFNYYSNQFKKDLFKEELI